MDGARRASGRNDRGVQIDELIGPFLGHKGGNRCGICSPCYLGKSTDPESEAVPRRELCRFLFFFFPGQLTCWEFGRLRFVTALYICLLLAVVCLVGRCFNIVGFFLVILDV